MGSNAASISLRRSTTTRATLDAEDDVVPGHGVVDGL
jgi:hypothetical protein